MAGIVVAKKEKMGRGFSSKWEGEPQARRRDLSVGEMECNVKDNFSADFGEIHWKQPLCLIFYVAFHSFQSTLANFTILPSVYVAQTAHSAVCSELWGVENRMALTVNCVSSAQETMAYFQNL